MYSEVKAAEATPADKAITTAPVEAETENLAPAPDEMLKGPEPTEGAEEQKKDVPLAAFLEERNTRKQMQAELRAIRERQEQQAQEQAQRDHDYQVAQQRLMQVIAARDQPAAPTPESDPLAYTAQVAAQTQQQVQALAQQQAQQQQWQQQQQQQWQQQQAQQAQVQQLVRLTTQSEAEFAKAKPDYNDAVQYAKNRRVKELVAAGYAQEDAAQFANKEGWQLAHTWLSQGMNPAERAYAFAQAMGYQPRASDEDVQEMHEQGQRAAKPSGSGTARGRNTLAAIAAMSPKQLASLSDDEFRVAMGG